VSIKKKIKEVNNTNYKKKKILKTMNSSFNHEPNQQRDIELTIPSHIEASEIYPY